MIPRHRLHAHNAGFTMIEVMVSMVILVGLMAAVYISFVSVADTAEIARTSTEELRIQQYLRDHFSNHLRAVHANYSGEYALVGEDESGAYGSADSLTFTTTLPTSGAKSMPGMTKTVEYLIDDPSYSEAGGFQTFAIDAGVEEKAAVTLFISERPLALVGLSGESEEFFEDSDEGLWQREIPIRSLNFEYYDGASEEWEDEWNSDDKRFLPWAVRVGVNLAKTEEQLRGDLSEGVGTEDEPDMTLVVVLPTGAGLISEIEFIDPNHYRPTESADGGSSIFDEEPG